MLLEESVGGKVSARARVVANGVGVSAHVWEAISPGTLVISVVVVVVVVDLEVHDKLAILLLNQLMQLYLDESGGRNGVKRLVSHDERVALLDESETGCVPEVDNCSLLDSEV